MFTPLTTREGRRAGFGLLIVVLKKIATREDGYSVMDET